MDVLTLIRSGESFFDHQRKQGLRGVVVIDDLILYTIERGDGFKWLRPGFYDCEMAYFTDTKKRRHKAIRVLGNYSKGRIYLHVANWPSELTGCVGVGLHHGLQGVMASRDAMVKLFEKLGGFKERKRVGLNIKGAIQ